MFLISSVEQLFRADLSARRTSVECRVTVWSHLRPSEEGTVEVWINKSLVLTTYTVNRL